MKLKRKKKKHILKEFLYWGNPKNVTVQIYIKIKKIQCLPFIRISVENFSNLFSLPCYNLLQIDRYIHTHTFIFYPF